jgi:TetR/AcrR family transcriptional regulator, cholesterol catabolism regulator
MTREEILFAAAQIFGQKGFHATSMQDIADAVNLQKASLYHHFESKQEILLCLLDSALDLLIERIAPVQASLNPPEEKLRDAMRIYIQTVADYQNLASVLLLEHRSLDPELRERHSPRRDRFEYLWRDLVHEGQEAGIFACSSSALTARALLGVMNWTITWYRKEGPLSPGEIADRFADLVLFGLVTRDRALPQ